MGVRPVRKTGPSDPWVGVLVTHLLSFEKPASHCIIVTRRCEFTAGSQCRGLYRYPARYCCIAGAVQYGQCITRDTLWCMSYLLRFG